MQYAQTESVELTTAWVEIAAANEPVLLQRTSGYNFKFAYADDEPDADADGYDLNDYEPHELLSSKKIWARSVGESVLIVSLGVAGNGASAYVVASDGVSLPIGSLAESYSYTSGILTTATVSYGGNTYVQTYIYTSGNLTGISQWVKQ